MTEYVLTTGMLRRWGACEGRFAPARLLPGRVIPLTPDTARTLHEHGYNQTYWLGYLLTRADRWDYFLTLAQAEVEALRLGFPATLSRGQDTAFRRMNEWLTQCGQVDATSVLHGLDKNYLVLHSEDYLGSSLWLLDMVLRTVDAVDPAHLDVYASTDTGRDDYDPIDGTKTC